MASHSCSQVGTELLYEYHTTVSYTLCRSNTDCACLCVYFIFQWSSFQLSGHRPHNRANRPVIWSYAPWRYVPKRTNITNISLTPHKWENKGYKNADTRVLIHWKIRCCICICEPTFDLTYVFYNFFLGLWHFSLQCCRAVVPPQLPRTVFLFPTGLMERSSKIRGENVFICSSAAYRRAELLFLHTTGKSSQPCGISAACLILASNYYFFDWISVIQNMQKCDNYHIPGCKTLEIAMT